MKNSIILVLFSVFIYSQKYNYIEIKPTDSQEDIVKKASNVVPTKRQLNWQKLELTAFFHFGVNTFTGKEWGTGKENPEIFNPEKFNAEQWITTVKQAGFRQVIITAKHHDGFCLWPTKTTEHSLKNSPWKSGKGDVVKAVADACRKYKIGFGVYLSPWDMNSKLYGTDDYNKFFEKQLAELLTNYGTVDEVWFDGANGEGENGKKQIYDFDSWYRIIRKLQPNAVIAIMGPDVRWVGTETGCGRLTEWSVVPTDNLDQKVIAENSQKGLLFKPKSDLMGDDLGSIEKINNAKGLVWYPAETDVSIRPGWFFKELENEKVKSAEELFRIYLSSVGRNSVLLLNIPPNKEGLLQKEDVESLLNFGKKLKTIFGNNLMKYAIVTSNNNRIKGVNGDKFETNFNFKNNQKPIIIDINLKSEKQFNIISLQENIENGQQVEGFEIEYWSDNQWKFLVKGTTVGYKRILDFEKVKSSKLRLKILQSRGNVNLSEVGVYIDE